MGILLDETGNWKSKMEAAKPDVPISQLVIMIAAKFQRLPPFNESSNSTEITGILLDVTGSCKSKMEAAKTGCTYISACRQVRNEVPTAIPKISRFRNSMELNGIL